MMQIKGLAPVAIQATDYQGTIDFYTRVFGFRVGHHWSLPSYRIQDASMLVSPDGRTCLENFDNDAVIAAQGRKAETADEIAHGALLHLAFYVENVEEMYQHVLEHRASTCREPSTLSLGEPPLLVKNALVFSPNGEVIELLEEVQFNRTHTESN
jgi:catechol 2,3-dioxygenase-like lactoylglutathione lyase family enzyme